jgi:Tol biopolymer transport system component
MEREVPASVLRDSFRLLLRPLAAAAAASSLAAIGALHCTPFKSDPPMDAGHPSLADSGSNSGDPDGGDASGHAGASCDPNKPFDAVMSLLPPTPLLPWASLRLAPDLLTGYFSGGPAQGPGGMYTSTRSAVDAQFGTASSIPGLGLDAPDEGGPTVSGDGLTLVFARNPNGIPARLYYATRANVSAPFQYDGLMPAVNATLGDDQTPFLREDGRVLYFVSSRVAGQGDDLYRSLREGSSYAAPSVVDELNSAFDEIGPTVTPDDLTIYFGSNRPGPNAQGNYDIFVATRASASEPFSAPRRVTEVNTVDGQIPSFVTRDRCALYFYGSRYRSPMTVFVATKAH